MKEETPERTPVEGVRRSAVIRHVLLSVALWVTYALYWRVVLSRGVEREARLAGVLLGLFVLLQILSTAAWVLHNGQMARRHGTRRKERAPVAPAAIEQDFLGRRLRTFPTDGDLRRVPVIVVRVEEGEKRFEAGMPLEPESGEER